MNVKLKLEEWYLNNKRNLIFRENKDPYKIWVSEIMLQQTRVNHMLPIYEKFIIRFPSIDSLANSTEEEVISHWKGLGYYSRAINLRLAAIYIIKNHNGKFPKTLEEILKIKGIGAYTSRAILSIAFNLPFAVLDGNVKRVLARFYNYKYDINSPKANKELQILADEFLNQKSPSNHNQAMMELGSLICTQNPICSNCPISFECKANILNIQKELPVSIKNKNEIELGMYFIFFKYEDKLLFTKFKKRRFFKKIYSIPFLLKGNSLKIEYMDKTNFGIYLTENFDELMFKYVGKHSITHHKIQIYFTEYNLNQSNKTKIENYLNSNSEIEYKWHSQINLENEFPSSIAKKINKVLHNET